MAKNEKDIKKLTKLAVCNSIRETYTIVVLHANQVGTNEIDTYPAKSFNWIRNSLDYPDI